MNKLYILFIPFILFIQGCSFEVTDQNNLQKKTDGLLYLRGENKPYNGRATLRNKDKLVSQEMSYKDGLLHGKWLINFPNGSPSVLGAYKEGKQHGKWRLYYENGKILAEEGYLNGKKNGRNRYYSQNGTLIEEINYLDGLQHGYHKIWNSEGVLIHQDYYIKGDKQ